MLLLEEAAYKKSQRESLVQGKKNAFLSCLLKPTHRCVFQVPEGVDWAAVVKNAMDKYSLEIAGGLGPTVGKIWRVGIMGYCAREENIELVLQALRDGLKQ